MDIIERNYFFFGLEVLLSLQTAILSVSTTESGIILFHSPI